MPETKSLTLQERLKEDINEILELTCIQDANFEILTGIGFDKKTFNGLLGLGVIKPNNEVCLNYNNVAIYDLSQETPLPKHSRIVYPEKLIVLPSAEELKIKVSYDHKVFFKLFTSTATMNYDQRGYESFLRLAERI